MAKNETAQLGTFSKIIFLRMKQQDEKWLKNYLQDHAKVLRKIPIKTIARIGKHLEQAAENRRTIFVFGNGGSASNTSHFATDLSKGASDATGKKFRVISLNDHVSLLTAIGNDYAYDDIFVRPLSNLARPGDLALTMSVSGNSPNVVKAITWAKKNGLVTIAFVGGKGGALASLSDITVKTDSLHYGRVEDCQMVMAHMICYAIMEQRTRNGRDKTKI